MSQYTLIEGEKKIVFGWDPPLQTFYLQVHDLTIENEDEQIIKRMGADPQDKQPGVALIVQEARQHGFNLDRPVQKVLYQDKAEGR